MTLGGAGRGPAGHREAVDAWGDAEIEELTAQPVTAGARTRVGFRGALAIAAMALFVAVGLGLLGGRPQATPAAAGDGPSASAEDSVRHGTAAPPATPPAPCGPEPLDVASIFLVVRGVAYPAGLGFTTGDPNRVDIHGDDVVEISAGDEPCSVDWRTELVDGAGVRVIRELDDLGRDPEVGDPNRFRFVLASLEAKDARLLATITSPTASVHASWAVHLVPFEPPQPRLRVADRGITLVQGCAVQLTLGDGQQQSLRPCSGDLAADPPQAIAASTGEAMTFDFGLGWQVETAIVTCGTVEERKFVVRADSGCPDSPRFEDDVSFDPPSLPGSWTVAISSCASQDVGVFTNRICGTWFAGVRVAA